MLLSYLTVHFCLGQDLIQHSSNGSSELNGSIRLSLPTINNQSAGATLTIAMTSFSHRVQH